MSENDQVFESNVVRHFKVGTATPSKSIKNLWKSETFNKAPYLSLKTFVRQLLNMQNPDAVLAKLWLSNKRGGNNKTRSDLNVKRVAAEKSATKSAKKGSQKK